MATSNDIDFTLNRNQIITLALQTINVVGDEDTIDDSTFKIAANYLNVMVKAWQAEGYNIWERKESTLFVNPGQNNYKLGIGGWHATNNYFSTTTIAANSLGNTLIQVNTIVGITVGDFIGVELSTNTRQWSTVTAINAGTRTITLADALKASVAINATVISYTKKINRPLAIVNARRQILNTSTQISLTNLNHTQYFNQSDRTSLGTINAFYYDAQLSAGDLYFWQSPNNVREVVNFTQYQTLQDFDDSTNNPDFPVEWLDALVLGLAVKLCIRYDMYAKYKALKMEAEDAKDKASRWNNEFGTITFRPQFR